jgi:hypothetical protein
MCSVHMERALVEILMLFARAIKSSIDIFCLKLSSIHFCYEFLLQNCKTKSKFCKSIDMESNISARYNLDIDIKVYRR